MAKDSIDPDDLEEGMEIDGEDLDILEDLEDEPLLDDDDELGGDDLDDDDEDDEDSLGATIVRKAGDEDEDEDDMVAPDDVEEDLASILKDRLASEDVEPDEDDTTEIDDRSSGEDALQPKREDEILCNSCFLIVRQNAPTCPVGDDACPIFAK